MGSKSLHVATSKAHSILSLLTPGSSHRLRSWGDKSGNWGLLRQAHCCVWQQKPGLPTWPEVPVLEGVEWQGQVKLQPIEKDLSMAGGLAGASSACGLRGGQLSRPEETERSLWKTYCVPSKSWVWLCHMQEEEVHQEHLSRTPGAARFPLQPAHLQPPSLHLCCYTSQWNDHSIFLGLYYCSSFHLEHPP